jgi:hypothetical protein
MWGSSDPSTQTLNDSYVIADATVMWYNNEINLFPSSDYGLANPDMSNFEGWGHYSQMIWKSTEQIGCAAVLCPYDTLMSKMYGWYSVCNYYPAGKSDGCPLGCLFAPLTGFR